MVYLGVNFCKNDTYALNIFLKTTFKDVFKKRII